MATVLICEPQPDICALLSFVVGRLGHEVAIADGTCTQLLGADALVFEPGDGQALALATWTRAHRPDVSLICTSIFPTWPEVEALEPDAYLVKPFPLHRLEEALMCALARRPPRASPRRDP